MVCKAKAKAKAKPRKKAKRAWSAEHREAFERTIALRRRRLKRAA